MEDKNKYLLGFLTVIVALTGVVLITLSDDVRIEVDYDVTNYYLNEDGKWVLAGTERVNIFQGSRRLSPVSDNILIEHDINEEDNTVTIRRIASYNEGPTVINTYFFDGNVKDRENFPVYHTVEVLNGEGFIVEYELRNIDYVGATMRDLGSVLYFGKSMKLEIDERMYWSTVYQSKIYKARFRPDSDSVSYNIRLFESPTPVFGPIEENILRDGETRIWVVLRDPVTVGMTNEMIAEQFAKQGVDITSVINITNSFTMMADMKTFNEIKKYAVVKEIYYDEFMVPQLNVNPTSVSVIGAPDMWNVQVNGLNVTGQHQAVCVIDTGVDYTHPDLGGCTTEEFLDGNCTKVPAGYDFHNNDDDPMDDHASSHGTHVAGIVAADGVIKGVAPDAKIIAVKSLGPEGGWLSNAVAGVSWCNSIRETYNISVITMSLGGATSYSSHCDAQQQSFANAVDSAVDNNIVVLAGTGNWNKTTGIAAPSCLTNILPIMGSTRTDGLYAFNNRGAGFPKILIAPGVSINSTIIGGGYNQLTGTSMATPHAAGAAALLKQYNSSLHQDQIWNMLNSSGILIYDSGVDMNFTRINVFDASSEDPGDPPPPPVIDLQLNITTNPNVFPIVWRVFFGMDQTAYDVEPVGQNIENPVWTIENNGTGCGDFQMATNQNYTGVEMLASTDHNRWLIELSTEWVNVYSNMCDGQSANVYLKRNYNMIPDRKNIQYFFRIIE